MPLKQNLKEKYTNLIKNKAKSLGFLACGISKAEFLEDHAPVLEKWLRQNMNAEMQYMENNFEKRLDPRLLVKGTKSVISLLVNYYPPETQQNNKKPVGTYKISKYAYGKDYHIVIKDKLKQLSQYIIENTGDVNIRGFVDSAPVLERAWAAKSGLGWIGKNSNLINKNFGSFFFICELLTDLELEYDHPLKENYCGKCTKCIDNCPNKAIVKPYILDANKCISYLTIELKNKIPEKFKGKYKNWIFGCDTCQDVCPWNRFAKPHKENAFLPNAALLKMNNTDWKSLTEKDFKLVFNKSSLKRTKYKNIARNIKFLTDK
jgi:epoxyqueuosine reductase